MKKIIGILVILFCLCSCYHTDYKSTTITGDELLQKFENKENFIVYAAEETCLSCKDYRAIVDDFCAKYEVTIYCYYCDDFESEEVKNFKYNYFYRLDETPTTYVVIEGKAVDCYVGTLSASLLKEIMVQYGFI